MLSKNNKSKKCSLHRLLALQYIPNLENKPQVDHIDKNPGNNCLTNLRWVTRSENCLNKKKNLHLLSKEELDQRNKKLKDYHAEWHKKNYPIMRQILGIVPRCEMTKTQQPNYDRDMTRQYRSRLTEEGKESIRKKQREKYAVDGLKRQREYITPEVHAKRLQQQQLKRASKTTEQKEQEAARRKELYELKKLNKSK